MMMLLNIAILLLFKGVTCLIVPEEVPTLLSLIYSNIPPIKKGTDSRLGIGFRLGEHADFQVMLELGPQTETEPIGVNTDAETKKKRAAIMSAAMTGKLGPWARAIASYQMERKIKMAIEKYKKDLENTKKPAIAQDKVSHDEDVKVTSDDWLKKWSQQQKRSSDKIVPHEANSRADTLKVVSINDTPKTKHDTERELEILRKLLQNDNKS